MANGYVCKFSNALGLSYISKINRLHDSYSLSELYRFSLFADIGKINEALAGMGFTFDGGYKGYNRAVWRHSEIGYVVDLGDAFSNNYGNGNVTFRAFYPMFNIRQLFNVNTRKGRTLSFSEDPRQYAMCATLMEYAFDRAFLDSINPKEGTYFQFNEKDLLAFKEKLNAFKVLAAGPRRTEITEFATARLIESYIDQLTFKAQQAAKEDKRAQKQMMQREIGDETADYLNDYAEEKGKAAKFRHEDTTSKVKMINRWQFNFRKEYEYSFKRADGSPAMGDITIYLWIGQRLNGSYYYQAEGPRSYYMESGWKPLKDKTKIKELINTLDTLVYSSSERRYNDTYKTFTEWYNTEVLAKF